MKTLKDHFFLPKCTNNKHTSGMNRKADHTKAKNDKSNSIKEASHVLTGSSIIKNHSPSPSTFSANRRKNKVVSMSDIHEQSIHHDVLNSNTKQDGNDVEDFTHENMIEHEYGDGDGHETNIEHENKRQKRRHDEVTKMALVEENNDNSARSSIQNQTTFSKLSTQSPMASSSASLSCYTPKTAMSSTPQTPPSPIIHDSDNEQDDENNNNCSNSCTTDSGDHSRKCTCTGEKINKHYQQQHQRISMTPPTPIPMDNAMNHDFYSTPASIPARTPSPLYDKHHPPSTTSTATLSRTSSTNSLQKKPKTQQLYLDFGQSSFGKRTICPTCNMLYVHGMKEDEEHHEKICNEYKDGVGFTKALLNYARIVYDERKIIDCTNNSSSNNGRSGRYDDEYGHDEDHDYDNGTIGRASDVGKIVPPTSTKRKTKKNMTLLNLFMMQNQKHQEEKQQSEISNVSSMNDFPNKERKQSIPRLTPTSSSSLSSSKNTDSCVVEIRDSDSILLKKKVMQVKSIVDQELGFNDESMYSNRISKHKGDCNDYSNGYIDNGDYNAYTSMREISRDSCAIASKSGTNRYNLGNKTAYLFIDNKRVIGFCTVEVISKAFLLQPADEDELEVAKRAIYNDCDGKNEKGNQETIISITKNERISIPNPMKKPRTTITSRATTTTNLNRSMKSCKAVMGIHQLWCHKSHRNKKIASKLLDTARMKFIYALNVPLDKVAFSSPTADGALFAKKYCCTDTPLVYDCN